MAEIITTKPTGQSVNEFLGTIKDEGVRKDCEALVGIMQKATKAPAKMWGSNIVGFGSIHYKYASGRELDWMLTAFSPRKRNITLYIMSGFEGYDDMLEKLGKISCGKSCLYIRRLSDIHVPTLQKLVTASVKRLTAKAKES